MAITSVKEIQELDKEIQDYLIGITNKNNAGVKPGSILRIPWYVYINWGIELTDNNKEELKKLSEEAYRKEWENAHKAKNVSDVINQSSKKAGLGEVNAELNKEIAKQVVDLLKNIGKKEEIRILDVGCGDGATSLEIIKNITNTIKDDQLKSIRWYVYDPIPQAVNTAVEKLKPYLESVEGYDGNMETIAINDETIDIIVTNAAIHHTSFLSDLVKKLVSLLKKQGVLLSGDWHTDLWHDPNKLMACFIPALLNEGQDIKEVISNFPLKLELKEMKLEQYLSFLKERGYPLTQADKDLTIFWATINQKLKDLRKTTPYLYLEAHEPIDRRKELFKNLGLEVEKIKNIRETGVAAVMTCKKS